MIKLGEIQKLEIIRKTSIGVYLNEGEGNHEEDVLLPNKQVPPDTEIGEEVEVFIYRDSQDRKIATTQRPKLTLGEIGFLQVTQVTKIGAFLDWNLEKDLFLPFREQTTRVKEGREYLVGVYIDKSDRLCATMDIHKLLSSESPYKEGDRVKGIIYSSNDELGLFVAVEAKYHGLIPKKELYGKYKIGDQIEGRITRVREDGKLDLSVREKSYRQMDKDAEIVLEKLIQNKGTLFLNDKSSPSKIKEELSMSKSAFKTAIGRLLKQGTIKFIENGIELTEKE